MKAVSGAPTRQRGMTTLGMLILVAFVGLFVFAGIRLTPVYLNYMKVAAVVNGVLEEFDGQSPNSAVIRRSISRRFDIESVDQITARDIQVTAKDGGFEVAATYEHSTPYISNLWLTVHFDKRVLIRR